MEDEWIWGRGEMVREAGRSGGRENCGWDLLVREESIFNKKENLNLSGSLEMTANSEQPDSF